MKMKILTRVKMISCILVLSGIWIGEVFGATPTPIPSPTNPPMIPTPTPSPTPDISVMVARLKAAKAANRAFVIYYVGGEVLVPNNTFIAFNPSGKFTWIYVFSGDDDVDSIPVRLITNLELVNIYPWDLGNGD